MPATSFSGDCLWRRSSSERVGSPSKSVITKSFCDDQHLAEMVVAVHPRLRARAVASAHACGCAPAAHRGRASSVVASSRAVAGKRHRAAAPAVRACAALRACTRRVHAAMSARRDRLGIECRVAAATSRTRACSSRGAYAERAHERQVAAVHIARRCRLGRIALARQAVEEPVEILERVAPAVALVADIRLQRSRASPRVPSLLT